MISQHVGPLRNVICLLFMVSSTAYGGSISGTVQELTGTPLGDVTIIVRDLSDNSVTTTSRTAEDGTFSIDLVDGAAISITFVDGIHEDAALIGISGFVVLSDFDIFMPQRKGGECENASGNCSAKPACNPGRTRIRYRRFRRCRR